MFAMDWVSVVIIEYQWEHTTFSIKHHKSHKTISILNEPAIPRLSANKTVPPPPDNPISENNQTMRLNMN